MPISGEIIDALFIGVGAQDSTPMGVEGEEQGYRGFIPGVRYLLDISQGRDPYPEGKKVVVVGGGNVAIDCVRSSFRIGKEDVNLVYRRTIKEMPADPVEIQDAEEEKVKFHYLCNPTRIIAPAGKVVGVECIRMELGEPDASGRRRPVPVPGSEFVIETDILIPAIGQKVDLSFLRREGGHQTDEVEYHRFGRRDLCHVAAGGVLRRRLHHRPGRPREGHRHGEAGRREDRPLPEGSEARSDDGRTVQGPVRRDQGVQQKGETRPRRRPQTGASADARPGRAEADLRRGGGGPARSTKPWARRRDACAATGSGWSPWGEPGTA